jgi:hypothetical protein
MPPKKIKRIRTLYNLLILKSIENGNINGVFAQKQMGSGAFTNVGALFRRAGACSRRKNSICTKITRAFNAYSTRQIGLIQ